MRKQAVATSNSVAAAWQRGSVAQHSRTQCGVSLLGVQQYCESLPSSTVGSCMDCMLCRTSCMRFQHDKYYQPTGSAVCKWLDGTRGISVSHYYDCSAKLATWPRYTAAAGTTAAMRVL